MQKYTVGIIGLGKIGMTFDYDSHDPNIFLSHLKAFYHHPRFEVKWVIDTNPVNIAKARDRYYGDIQFLESINVVEHFTDVVVIATQTVVTRDIFHKLKNNKEIKIFVIEKPFWDKNWIFDTYENLSSKCVINYFRKYMPFVIDLKERMVKGEFGRPLNMQCHYTKGLVNNGSHFIDLANFLFGPSFDSESIQIINKVDDYVEEDPSVSFTVNYQWEGVHFPIIFQCGDERIYSQIEWNIYFEKSRVRVYDFEDKLEYFELKEDPLFNGYLNLQSLNFIKTDIKRYAWYMCDYLIKVMEAEYENSSSLKAEYINNKLLEEIKKKLKHE